jgi:hypothetical protein
MFDRTRMSLTAALLAAASWICAAAGAAEKDEAYALEVENASAKVGEPTEIKATLTTLKGHKVSKSYRNRLIELSAQDEGVTFEEPVVVGKQESDTSVEFDIGVTPTRPGTHVINGVFRFGFHNAGRLNMVSIPLIATVEGTE